MQNRYAGDIGDYSKFLLLRRLFGETNFRLGLIWFLYPDESHNRDGRHIAYLENPDFRACDPQLVSALAAAINTHRDIKGLQTAKLLPSSTVYFSEPLDFHLRYRTLSQEHKMQRTLHRQCWLDNACKAVEDCELIMLDPDNGLEVSSCAGTHLARAGKFTFYHEVEALFEGKQACVLYQHLNRSAPHRQQIQARLGELKQRIGAADRVFALRYAPYTPRAYFILAREPVAKWLRPRIEAFLGSICGVGWDTYHAL